MYKRWDFFLKRKKNIFFSLHPSQKKKIFAMLYKFNLETKKKKGTYEPTGGNPGPWVSHRK
jgi:hypothetical protein